MLSDHVTLTITSGTVSVGRIQLQIPMIISCNAGWTERTRTYNAIEDVADDFATTAPEYLAANALFSQEPRPATIMIGRAVGKPTMVSTISVTSVALGNVYALDVAGEGVTATECSYTTLADLTFTAVNATETLTSTAHGMSTGDGPFRVSNSGGALPAGYTVDTDYWIIRVSADTYQLATSYANAIALTAQPITTDGTGTQTLRRNQNDVICAQLVQALNAVVGKNYTAAQVTGAGETDYITVTASTAGNWFSVAPTDFTLLDAELTHSEPGTTIAADLTAIRAESDDWYVAIYLYNSDACIKAMAAAIEPLKKLYAADLPLSDAATGVDGSGDTGDDLQGLGYDRTFTVFNANPSEMNAAAWVGSRISYAPGSATWKFANLDGVTAYGGTATHRANMVAKNINFYETTAGRGIMSEGVTASGEFIDKMRNLDFLEDDVTKSIFELLSGSPIVPMSNSGIAQVETVLRGSLTRAANMGIIDADFTITVPLVSDISSANRGIRLLPDVKFSCRLQGAIHKVNVTGVVSV